MPWQAPSYSKITRGERSQRGSGAAREAPAGASPRAQPGPAPRAPAGQRGHPRSLSGAPSARPGPARRDPRPALRGAGRPPGSARRGGGGALGRASARAPGGERPRRRESRQRLGTGSPRHPPPPPSVCLLCFGTVPPARPSVRRPLTAPPAPPRNSCLNSACARGVRGCPRHHPPGTVVSFPKRGGEGGGIARESDEELPSAHREHPGDAEGSRASWKGTDPKRRGKSAGRERHMDDDDEDEDEDGDGDPDAPPAPAAPLLLTSASSTSASHRWPQPPPTSTVRHIDTATARPPPPPLPRPHTAPAPPAHRPSPGADTHPPPRRPHGLGWGRAGLRGNRGAGPGRDAAPRGAPRTAPRPLPDALPHPLPALVISFYLFPSGKGREKKKKSPSGCEQPLPAHGLRSAGRGSGGSVRCPSRRRPLLPSPAEPPGRRRERSPFPPPRVCGSGRWRRGEPRAPRGMGRREGAEFSAVCEGDKVWGAWPLSSSSGWNSCGRSGWGGLPGQGPGWLAACPPGCGAGLSLITRDLTCPGGQRGLELRWEAGERRGLAAGEKSGHGARKRPRPQTFLPGAAPMRSAARGGSGSSGARPPARGSAPGIAPRAPLSRPRGAPARPALPPSFLPSFPPSLPGPERRVRRERVRGADAESRSGAHGQGSRTVTRARRAGSGTSPDLQTWWGAIAPTMRVNTSREPRTERVSSGF
ncbi:basic proline-rich protein-like [Oenanthe melanoleuca]|uniref:basic proline-rich protein-like n=1 Tax=Oenanthe melanoleuca TaxID=2939378 RepID=UPI0024C1E819|nr:basic proline-rich protein-like [Oenanthe melanoleuca]